MHFVFNEWCKMNLYQYIRESERTNHNSLDLTDAIRRSATPDKHGLQHAAMGMITESAEFMDQLKKHIQYGKELDWVNLGEELGDLMWYIALAARIIEKNTDVTLEDWLERNIKKLKERYPERFENHQAININISKEREILEGHA